MKISLSLLSMIFFNSSYSQPFNSYDDYGYDDSNNQNYSPSHYANRTNQDHRYFYSQNNDNYSEHPIDSDYSSSGYHQKYYDGNSPQIFDWNFHESWRDQRKAFYSGETQAEAYRKNYPYDGKGGIGYDGDPTYMKMKNDYEHLKAENDRYLAENNRLANRGPGENQEYYSRGGGGSSQKGKASRQSRQGGGNLQNYQSYSQDDYRYNQNPPNSEYRW